jgi:hypothetical protein
MTPLWLMLDVMAKKGRVKSTNECLEPSKKLVSKVKSNIEYVVLFWIFFECMEVIKKYFLSSFVIMYSKYSISNKNTIG